MEKKVIHPIKVNLDKITAVMEHIANVQRNCNKIGFKLIKQGEVEMGRKLIANGQIHDNSKFEEIEFNHLFTGCKMLKDVVKHHATTNPHHPEYWGNINEMPEVYIAEMVCDCAARSSEFGTDLREWFNVKAPAKYNIKPKSRIDKLIHKYLDMLLTPAFS